MAVTNYYTVNGKIRGEGTAAGGFRPYGHDALGSVVATYDSTGALQNTYRNAPYGTQVAKTGTAPDPAFLYNGGSGYRTTGRNYSPYYVRKRHFDNKTAQWTTADPLWPLAALFVYALANPIHFSDSAGLFVLRDLNCQGCGSTVGVYVEPGDSTGVVGGAGKTGGAGAITQAEKWSGSENCLAVNGGFFSGNSAVGPTANCFGEHFGGNDLHGGLLPVPVRTGSGSITGSGRPTGKVPTGSSLGTGRTGACVDQTTRTVSAIMVTEHGSAGAFRQCAEGNCPFGSNFVWLDGSGSSQIWSSTGIWIPGWHAAPVLGGWKTGAGRPDWRSVNNWIVICR